MTGSSLHAICLMGPTATGKTAAALEIARRFPVGIISVDSAMVYRGLDIGTGKPSATVLAAIPHRLVDIRDPLERYSAGDFVRDARAAVREISARGLVPLLVGGTLLYFRSLFGGLAEMPGADPAIRAALDARGQRDGWPALHAELARVDPEAAARIRPGDRQRIQRALEVHALTGQPLSVLQKRGAGADGIRFTRIAVVPPDRAILHRRIEERLRAMLDAGFIDEVAALRRLPGMTADTPSMRAVGYRQIWQHLDGAYGRDEAELRVLAATRQLAKRQLTWLRREERDFELDGSADSLADALFRLEGLLSADALSPATR